ncbi:MAG: adenine deaminase, partial [Spirochaetes bacterium]
MRTSTDIKAVVDAGLGRTPCDLKLENLRLVNVFTSEIIPTDVYIIAGRIVSIHPDAGLEASHTEDCGGLFAVPGFIDTHMHFETTLLTPESLGDVILPWGTTTLCMDAMEIANVSGIQGLKEILKSIKSLTYRAFMEVSSRVPTAPGLETTGGVLGLAEVEELLDWNESLSLGEIDPSKIFIYGGEYFEKIAAAHARGKIVNGHAIGRLGQELNVYASAGISDDHECVEYNELLERIRLGLAVLIREGSSERNVDKLIAGVLENKLATDRLMFCTDDKHVNDILREGHINYNVNRSIELGMNPIQAIQMATINAARHFRVEGDVGSLSPGRLAD